MSAPEDRWWSVRAGEYVLGTLRDNDLELFETILANDTEMQAAVTDWERRLAGLNEGVAEKTPGKHVLQGILKEIRSRKISDTFVGTDIAANAAAVQHPALRADLHDNDPVNNVEPATDSLSGWRSWAGLATAASLVMGILLFQQSLTPSSLPLSVDGFAIILGDESGEPYFLVETDYENLNIRVTALFPPSVGDMQDLQLWQALPDRSAVRPVVLLPEEAGVARTFKVKSLVRGSDLFGISIEPVGADTKNGPTGPVVAHGDFLHTQGS